MSGATAADIDLISVEISHLFLTSKAHNSSKLTYLVSAIPYQLPNSTIGHII
jgi:hypothetical protein